MLEGHWVLAFGDCVEESFKGSEMGFGEGINELFTKGFLGPFFGLSWQCAPFLSQFKVMLSPLGGRKLEWMNSRCFQAWDRALGPLSLCPGHCLCSACLSLPKAKACSPRKPLLRLPTGNFAT